MMFLHDHATEAQGHTVSGIIVLPLSVQNEQRETLGAPEDICVLYEVRCASAVGNVDWWQHVFLLAHRSANHFHKIVRGTQKDLITKLKAVSARLPQEFRHCTPSAPCERLGKEGPPAEGVRRYLL